MLARGGQRVVDGVTADFCVGQWVALVGPNGAGKSSLLTLLAGLQRPDSGAVELQGQPLAQWPARERAQRLAWLAQQGLAEGDLSVRDIVRLGRLPRHGLLGTPDAADEAAVDCALAETETTAYAGRRLNELSGGERQRVLLARALATEAQVLLLDEPTTHLDAPHQRALLRGLRQRAAAGTAVLAVLHDLNQALQADRVLVMARGHLVADGAPADAPLQRVLMEVFDGAFTVEPLLQHGRTRWLAVPSL